MSIYRQKKEVETYFDEYACNMQLIKVIEDSYGQFGKYTRRCGWVSVLELQFLIDNV